VNPLFGFNLSKNIIADSIVLIFVASAASSICLPAWSLDKISCSSVLECNLSSFSLQISICFLMNNELEIIKKFPNLFIWHYFNDLRTQIDISYLKLLTKNFDKKSKIIKTWTKLINKLNELESEYSNKKHNKCSLNNKTILFNEIEDSLVIVKNEWTKIDFYS
jgi:hypothetical protein